METLPVFTQFADISKETTRRGTSTLEEELFNKTL